MTNAQLSLDLATWLSESLGDEGRAVVERQRQRSFQALARELEIEPSDDLPLIAGVPSAADAQRLLRAVRAELA